MVEGRRTLLFSGNYPNWELGDPFEMIEGLPEAGADDDAWVTC